MPRPPWLDHYDAGVPETLAPYPARTLVDYISDHARTHPDGRALLFKGATMTYAELERLSDAFASALLSLGVARGTRIGLLLPNCPQFFIAELGAWKVGAIVAPLNPIYTEAELEGPIRENGIDTIVTLTRFYDRVKRVQARVPIRHVIATNIKEYFPAVLKILFTVVREKKDGDRVKLASGDHWFASMLTTHANASPMRAGVTQDDPAVLLMSGGTTGTPKGVLGTHGAYSKAGLQIGIWMRAAITEGKSVIMLPLPMFHVYGNVGVQGFAFVTRNPLAIVPNPRDLPDLLKTVNRVKPTFFNGVPTLYVGLLNHPDVQKGKVDFKSIRLCFSGAAPLMADTKKRFEELTGGRIVEGYSLTEAMIPRREPGRGAEQARLRRHAAPGYQRPHLRRRRRRRGNAHRRSGRDLLLRPSIDGRLLEPAGGNIHGASRPRGRCRRAPVAAHR